MIRVETAGVLLVAIAVSGCGGPDADAAAQQQQGARPSALVRVAYVTEKAVAPRIVAVGTITPVDRSTVASGANGVVTEFVAEEGRYVKKDDALSVLRMKTTDLGIKEAEATLSERQARVAQLTESQPEDIAHAKAMLAAATATEKNAKSTLDRTKKLHGQNAANDSDLEDAQQRWEAAQQSMLAAAATLRRTQNSAAPEKQQAEAQRDAQTQQVAWLKAEKDKRTTRAPFNGFVVQEHSFVGQWLSKGDPVVTLARLDEVDVTVRVDQWDLPHIRLGETADVIVEGVSPRVWQGVIADVVPRSDWQSGSRSFPVMVRIKNSIETKSLQSADGKTTTRHNPVLKEGMMAEVTFAGDSQPAVMVPKDALVRDTRGTFLHVYQPADPSATLDPKQPAIGSTQQVPVEPLLSLSEGNLIAVRVQTGEPGGDVELKAGVVVVTEGGERLRPLQENVAALAVADAK